MTNSGTALRGVPRLQLEDDPRNPAALETWADDNAAAILDGTALGRPESGPERDWQPANRARDPSGGRLGDGHARTGRVGRAVS